MKNIIQEKNDIIEQLKNDFSLDLLEVVTHQVSSDGTQKFLFRLQKEYYKAIIYYISGMTDNFAIDIYNEIIRF